MKRLVAFATACTIILLHHLSRGPTMAWLENTYPNDALKSLSLAGTVFSLRTFCLGIASAILVVLLTGKAEAARWAMGVAVCLPVPFFPVMMLWAGSSALDALVLAMVVITIAMLLLLVVAIADTLWRHLWPASAG